MDRSVTNYDELSDTLYVSFAPGEKATGIELNDHILLRINKAERRAVGLTFFEYSLLAQRTEWGMRSFPMSGLAQLSEELRQLVVTGASPRDVRDCAIAQGLRTLRHEAGRMVENDITTIDEVVRNVYVAEGML